MSEFTKKKGIVIRKRFLFHEISFFSTKYYVRNLEMCLLKKNVIIREGR